MARQSLATSQQRKINQPVVERTECATEAGIRGWREKRLTADLDRDYLQLVPAIGRPHTRHLSYQTVGTAFRSEYKPPERGEREPWKCPRYHLRWQCLYRNF
jgi:hypothetical protein